MSNHTVYRSSSYCWPRVSNDIHFPIFLFPLIIGNRERDKTSIMNDRFSLVVEARLMPFFFYCKHCKNNLKGVDYSKNKFIVSCNLVEFR